MWYNGNKNPINITKPLDHDSVKGFVYLCKRLNIRSIYGMALLAQIRFEMAPNWKSSKAQYNNLWAMRPPDHRPKYYKDKYYQQTGEAGWWCLFETQFDALLDRISRDINFGFKPPQNAEQLHEYMSKVSQSGYATGSNNHYLTGWASNGTYINENFGELFRTNLEVYPTNVALMGGFNHDLHQLGHVTNNVDGYDPNWENYVGGELIKGELHKGKLYMPFGSEYEMLPLPIFNTYEEREEAMKNTGSAEPPQDSPLISDTSGIFETIRNLFAPLFAIIGEIAKLVWNVVLSLARGGLIGIIILLILIYLLFKLFKK